VFSIVTEFNNNKIRIIIRHKTLLPNKTKIIKKRKIKKQFECVEGIEMFACK
jgi:hypothetical protein